MDLTSGQLATLNKKKIADGGEGVICDYGNDLVAKMYLPHVNKASKEQKVKAFIQVAKSPRIPTTVKLPKDVITVNNNFVGYIMGKVKNGEPIYYLTKTKQLAMLNFNNRDVLGVLLNLWETVEILFNEGIILGDVSGYNFLLDGRQVFFIDTESWGILNKFSPDAYTEMYTDPRAFNPKGGITQSMETDLYALAVLTFEILTKIHPYGGTYNPDKTMKIPERAKKRLSVLGSHDIKIPNKITSWNWMSPYLIDKFNNIFEGGAYKSLLPELKDLHDNMNYCKTHDNYYYNKYSDCPLCNPSTSMVKVPVPVTKTVANTNALPLTTLFNKPDTYVILNSEFYYSTDKHIVGINTGKRVLFTQTHGARMGFFNNDANYYHITFDTITLFKSSNDATVGTIERYPSSNYLFKRNCLYYIDISENLVMVEVTDLGNKKQVITPSYHSIFDVSDSGEVLLASIYPDKIVIEANKFTHVIHNTSNVNEYGIHYDEITKQWLFVYLLPNGSYRTIIFSKTIEYDSTALVYEASTLSNLCFFGGTIYEPSSGLIRGTNISKNSVKEFECSVVTGDSKLKLTNGKFIIVNAKKIYQFG